MLIPYEGPARAWQAAWQETADALAATGEPAAFTALRQGFALTHQQVRAAGCSDADIRRRVYRGEWSVPHRGVVSVLPPGDGMTPSGDRLEVRAAATVLVRPSTVISHGSAAAAYGLPVFAQEQRPALTSARIPRTADRGGARIYAATLEMGDVHRWFGAPITSPARTIVDLARHGRRNGLIAADAALHELLVTPAQLDRALRRASGWPGIRRARAVLTLACRDVESPLESLIRLLCADHGIPLPVPQQWVATSGGRFRVDGMWIAERVVLEADGMIKYAVGTDALLREKRRQEWLERAGYRVVRVTWDDVVNHPYETVARIRHALALACCSA